MNLNTIVKLYPNVDKNIIKTYKPADRKVRYHENDPHLKPIELDIEEIIRSIFKAKHANEEFPEKDLLLGYIPECWHLIEGFGLPAKDQKFVPDKKPRKLVDLEKRCETLEEIWDILEVQKEKYAKELAWINNQWHYRLYGKWVFINGKPTYVPPWHWMYCSKWSIDVGLPDYRDRDRRIFLFYHYAHTTTKAPFLYRRKVVEKYQYSCNEDDYLKWQTDYKKLGRMKPEQGIFWVEYDARTCYGVNHPKHRRDGATFRAQCVGYEIGTRTNRGRVGTQSMDESHAKKAFLDKYVQPYKMMDFYFKPLTSSLSNPQKSIKWESSTTRSGQKGTRNSNKIGLQTVNDYATTAARGFYDGDKLVFLHLDEEGKTIEENVWDRWQVLKQCLAVGQGSKIVGFNLSTSTVGEMTRQGGEPYFRLCHKDSDFYQRNHINGQTKSGKINLFIPAYDGLEGFIDEYGASVIETPSEPVKGIDGRFIKVGSKEYLEQTSAQLLADGSHESLQAWHEQKRLFPTQWMDCWIASASETGFNIKILSDRIQDLSLSPNKQPVRGNFFWEIPFKKANFKPQEDGLWMVSMTLEESQRNRIYESDGTHYPSYPGRFVTSMDPFKFTKVQGKRLSDAGAATFYNRDVNIDPDSKPIEEWETHRFVCDYLGRTDNKLLMSEHFLMQCIYYGSMAYPEINVPDVWDKFVEWGFEGLLLYDYDPIQQKKKETPGFNSVEVVKQDLFLEIKQYIELHGAREKHIRILKQCLDIRGLEDMTNYDLFTAAAGCLRGVKSQYSKLLRSYMNTDWVEDSDTSQNIDYGLFLY